MGISRKFAFCVLAIVLLLLVQGVAAAEGEAAGTGREFFRDDSPALGIDHSRPNSYLVYDLQKKLVAAKAGSLGLSTTEIEGMVSRINPPSGWKPAVASKGTKKILVFLVDFPDYPHGSSQGVSDVSSKMNGPGDAADYPTDNLHDFYERSSYNQLDLDVSVYGWYRADHNRNNYEGSSQWDIFDEVLTDYDSQIYYPDFDNDKDGDIDNIWIIWTGPDGGWNSAWWAYHTAWRWSGTPAKWDGVYPVDFVWEWYTNPWSTTGLFDSQTPCHEFGHVLGLPDYYDYIGGVGPDGGVGGFDMMDGNWVDHNSFSKYLLGWIQPTVIGENPRHASGGLYPAGTHQSQTSAIIMPGATVNDWGEFFLAENRAPGYGNDPAVDGWTKKGLTIWHVDATVDPVTRNFKYNNSRTDHKLLRLMEADGEEDIENNRGWDQNDIYGDDQFFGASTTPGSRNYAGSATLVNIHDISEYGGNVFADYAIGNYPPAITSIYPDSGTQNTLLTISDAECSDYWSHPKTDLYFSYWTEIFGILVLTEKHATNVTIQDVGQISCTFDLSGVPPGVYTITMKNPDGQYASLTDALTVRPPQVTVTVPNGGENWYTGTTHTITWEQKGLTGTNVKIDLWKNWPVGTRVRNIAASVPAGAGTYSWTIPSDIAPSDRYWVNISSISYPAVMDETDGWLTLTKPIPSLSLKKSISRDNVTWADDAIDVSAGGTVYYNITLVNTGTVTLIDVPVTDDGPLSTGFLMSPGSVWKLYYSKTAGSVNHTNVATATGTSAFGNAPVVTDSATYHVVASAVKVSPAQTDITKGTTRAVDIVLDKAPMGVQQYRLTISPSDPQYTEILSVEFPAWVGTNSYTEGLPGDTIIISGIDANNLVPYGSTNVSLGKLTIRGDVIGTTAFNIQVNWLQDDQQKFMTPSVVPGTIRVIKACRYLPIDPLPGYTDKPTDPDGDCICEDLNANGRMDFADVVLYFNQMDWIAANEPIAAFDLNGNGRIDFADIVALFNEI